MPTINITITLIDNESLGDALKQLVLNDVQQDITGAAIETQTLPAVPEPAPAPAVPEPAPAPAVAVRAPAVPEPLGDNGPPEPPADLAAFIAEPTLEVTEGGEVVDPNLDGDGLPWDERIHSSNGLRTGKGVWQKRRNVDPSILKEVVNELLGVVAVPAPPPAPTGPPAPAGSWDWNTLVKALTQAIKEGRVTKVTQDEALKELGIDIFPLLSPRTDLYDAFCAKLGLNHDA